MPDLFSGDFSTLVGLVIAGFLLLIVVVTLLAVRRRRRSAESEQGVHPSDGSRSSAMRTHLEAAELGRRHAEAAHQEAVRNAIANSAPPPPPPPGT